MPEEKKPGFSRDSISNTLVVAIGVSLVCSVLVSAAAIVLRPLQEANQNEFRQRIVLEVAGLYDPDVSIEQQFDNIETRLVDLETGEYVDDLDPQAFDAEAAANDPKLGVKIPKDEDIASIGRRAVYAPVYIVMDGGEPQQYILPVRGKGLWSTLYGYLSVEPDGRTVSGLRFYEHAETPGLGDQIEREAWLAQWPGQQLFDEQGDPQIKVVRGTVQPGPDAIHQVDGLSGATLTANGVTNLIRYWTGSHGFGPYLANLSSEANDNG
ncbi:MAG TPA: Na(+)-translocating NADH-quinone reductase subunit C [Woeseiaceae bacterium]|nr:Na(+)-translocating NADH-quinone reductase subunit C [Woeseiaceae bacterium]